MTLLNRAPAAFRALWLGVLLGALSTACSADTIAVGPEVIEPGAGDAAGTDGSTGPLTDGGDSASTDAAGGDDALVDAGDDAAHADANGALDANDGAAPTDVAPTDAQPDDALGAGPDPAPACVLDGDCDSAPGAADGRCLITVGGSRRCALPCVDDADCAAPTRCLPDGASPPTARCLDPHLTACTPCDTDADCAAPGLLGRCLPSELAGVGFCATPCAPDCPGDAVCSVVTLPNGQPAPVCLPLFDAGAGGQPSPSIDGCLALGCSGYAVAVEASASCESSADCPATRRCLPSDAAVAPAVGVLAACATDAEAAEVCDGLDNDCDGVTDDQGGGLDVPCDDGVGCTVDSCAGGAGCTHTPDASLCSDGVACTTDACDVASGACLYTPNDAACDDGVACSTESCDAAKGCVYTTSDAACADDIACTGESCEVGEGCQVFGLDTLCNDGLTCTVDSCDVVSGCSHAPTDAACDDGLGCTVDACTPTVGCTHAPDQSACDDGVDCTLDVCDPQQGCVANPSALACDDGVGCTVDVCDPPVGCTSTVDPGACDDANPCTSAGCDPQQGCVSAPLPVTACDDGSVCTTGDSCVDGACTGEALDCDDGSVCTLDGCDPLTGCTSTPAPGGPCDDGDACTGPDVCDADAACVASPLDCDDGQPCTADGCVAGLGCEHTPLPNALTCTTDAVTGYCVAGACTALHGGQVQDVARSPGGLCAVAGGHLYCAGAPFPGYGSTLQAPAPIVSGGGQPASTARPTGVVDAARVSLTRFVGCLTTTAGQLRCWHHLDAVPAWALALVTGVAPEDGQGALPAGSLGTVDALESVPGGDAAAPWVDVDLLASPDQYPNQAQTHHLGCGLRADGHVGCWGPKTSLPGSAPDVVVPKPAAWWLGDTTLGALSSVPGGLPGPLPPKAREGWLHVGLSALRAWAGGGKLGCAGLAGKGLLGQGCGDTPASVGDTLPIGHIGPVGLNAEALVCGEKAVCVRGLSGDIRCWGLSPWTGAAIDSKQPLTVVIPKPAVSIACIEGADASKPALCAALEDGSVWCWGHPAARGVAVENPGGGKLGTFPPQRALGPDGVTPLSGVQRLFGGRGEGLCGVLSSGAFACWAPFGAQADEAPVVLPGVGGLACASADDCDDGEGCTADLCLDATCQFIAALEGSGCEDGDVCTVGDTCARARCVGGSPADCDDGLDCTADSCAPGQGCSHQPQADACPDGAACQQAACDLALGCTLISDDTLCDDGVDCTADVCTNSGCAALPDDALCEDGNSCTGDTCELGGGCKQSPVDGQPCDDGDACTVGEACLGAACVPAGANACDDGLPCTADACDSELGCSHVPADDGFACAPWSACQDAVCIPTSATPWAAGLAAGTDSTCAWDAAGAPYCWGSGAGGKLGSAVSGAVATPVAVAGLAGVGAAGVGAGHACWVTDSGVFCAGADDTGQLGNGLPFASAADPTKASLLGALGALDCGQSACCGLSASGKVVCWGSNAFLQIGALTPGATGPIQPPLATMADLAVGANHACAISESGQTRCWGDGAFGQNGDIDGKPLVGQNIIAPPAADVAAGDAHSCILGQQGELWCWGDNSAGQLGRGVAAPGIHPPAPAIAVPNGLVEIVAGGGHTCARGGDGSVWCWGRNDHGQLGLGDTDDRLLPVKLASVGDVVALALGTAHTCALRQDGAVWCWGDNTSGQLGIGSAAPLWTSPQPVGPPTP